MTANKTGSALGFTHAMREEEWGQSVIIMGTGGICSGRVYQYSDDKSKVYIEGIYVTQANRGMGVGRLLLWDAEGAAKSLGATEVVLWADGNSWVRGWYERNGYVAFMSHEQKVGAVWMSKNIGTAQTATGSEGDLGCAGMAESFVGQVLNEKILGSTRGQLIKLAQGYDGQFLHNFGLMLEGFSLPLEYDMYAQSIYDADRNLVLDIRGWGRLQKIPNGEQIQDGTGWAVMAMLNAYIGLVKEGVEQERGVILVDSPGMVPAGIGTRAKQVHDIALLSGRGGTAILAGGGEYIRALEELRDHGVLLFRSKEQVRPKSPARQPYIPQALLDVGVGSLEALQAEYERIENKQSTLSSRCRSLVVTTYEGLTK